ncbi:MAG: condensation domain-containing protein, partial [Vicinamibacterales bacterium]
MTTVELFAHLRALGVNLWVEGGQVRCRAPRGTLTAALEGELVRRKAEVLAFLERARDACGAPHIPCVPREGCGLPLSFGQRRLWFLDRMQPGNPAYNIFVALAMTGPLDVTSLRHSLSEVVQRHESLRTVLPAIDGAPVQVVRPATPIDLPEEDLRAVPHASRHDALLTLAQEESRRPFDLAVGPLCRGRLVRLDEHEHVLCWTMHHSIGDGWSLGVLVRDLAAYYNGTRDGQAVVLPDLPIQYADYAAWQQSWLDDRRLAPLLAFWQQQLSRSGPLHLPTDRPRPASPAFQGARHRFTWDRDLHERLVTFSRSHDVTPFMTLLAALFILLSRHSGQDDVVIGSPIANRTHPLTQHLIGFFVNTLALRGDLSQNPPVLELLQQVKQTALGAYEHQELPFERLVESTRQARDLGRNPIFDVMCVYQNVPIPSVTFSGLDVRPLEIEHTLAKFDLTWDLFETAGTFSGRIQYRTDLYDAATVARLGTGLLTVIEGMLAEPNRRVRDLPLVDAAERRAVMAMACGPADRGTPTTARATAPRGLHQAFDGQATHAPGAIAVVDEHRRLTYAQLQRRSNALAWRVRAAGVRADACVGLWTDRTVDTIAAILGIWKAGGAYVPVDPAWPRDRIDLVLGNAGARVIVAPAACASALTHDPRTVVAVDESAEEQAPDSRTSLESAAYVM